MEKQLPSREEQQVLSVKEQRELFNRQWTIEKDLRHQKNMQIADRVIYRGTYYIQGQGQ